MSIFKTASVLLVGNFLMLALSVRAQNPVVVPPLEIRPAGTLYNYQSLRGVPISSTPGSPLGSDGRVPASQPAGMTQFPPTPGQYQSVLTFGGLAAPAADKTLLLNPGLSYAANAKNLDLPRSENNGVVGIVMPFARVGSPFLSRSTSFLFGDVIPVPDLTETGSPLPSNVAKEEYWEAEPFRPVAFTVNDILDVANLAGKFKDATHPVSQYLTNRFQASTLAKLFDYPAVTDDATMKQALVDDLNAILRGASIYSRARFTNVVLSVETQNLHPDNPVDNPPLRLNRLLVENAYPAELAQTAASYYWSPNARAVFAIQSGPVLITWKKRAPSAMQPAGKYIYEAGNYYALCDKLYVVSGSTVKPPRKIYWTEGVYRNTGMPVAIPIGQVGVVNVVFNNNFPERVAKAYQPLGQTPLVADSSQMLQETRTLWCDQQLRQILAYNQEGRVFVELLGDSGPDGHTRSYLGFEIVDVSREPNAADVTIELGERLTAYPPAENKDDSQLFPSMIGQTGLPFAYQRFIGGTDRQELYATRATQHANDLLVHWLEAGLQGFKWPFLFVRYQLLWPADASKYSHYVRPLVSTEEEAKATAIVLPADNAPTLEFQDPLDRPRGKFTESFSYFTFLVPAYPAHRALIRYTSGDQVAFERIFSWLDQNLKTTNFSGTLATNLSAWDPGQMAFSWPDGLSTPRIVYQTVDVGRRLEAPEGELTADANYPYLAGYIRQTGGTLFDTNAYIDPFGDGFEKSAAGAIIPVNAVPGANQLEVWWFRKNTLDVARGFKPVYWPSTIGRYTLQWPATASEIVLAGNDGSGPLSSLEAGGRIYYQNDRAQPGFNPNEEHALMQGGQVYALRDDLNLTNTANYSSHPFVLLEYTAADGRPAMRLFLVRRERPEMGVTFEYPVAAGFRVQPPMPLPLLEKPLAPLRQGEPPRSLNQETTMWLVTSNSASDSDGLLAFVTKEVPIFGAFRLLSLQKPSESPVWFYSTSVDVASNGVGGFVSLEPPRYLTAWTTAWPTNAQRWRFGLEDPTGLSLNTRVLLANPLAQTNWIVTVRSTNTVSGNSYVEVEFAGNTPESGKSASVMLQPRSGQTNNQYVNWRLAPEFVPAVALQDRYAAFTLQDRKGDVWVYRGPHQASEKPFMVMQFYYKTMSGFFFPSLAYDRQPAAGTITPYLRSRDTNGVCVGDPVYGLRPNSTTNEANALGIVYRPYWPDGIPVLQLAETLTLPKRGLPSVRGQSSLEVVYQQPQAAGGEANRAAVLHDPTRDKVFTLGPRDGQAILGKIPDSIKTEVYRGKTYFPNLPPHLCERFFLDPNRGPNGALVFQGQFVDEPVGEKYLLLNVLGSMDLNALRGLCLNDDPDKAKWDAAVSPGLTATMELFQADPAKPGTFIPMSLGTVGPSGLCAVSSANVAVDSYALTATGPGVGYVTLIAGNGLAFTPEEEPVSVQVIRVVDTLFRGEVKVIASSNPLSEKLTLQQVVDLAGAAQDYRFEWKIAAPVDGMPPVVYQNQPRNLLGNGVWTHVRFPLAGDNPATIQTTPAARQVRDVETSVVAVSPIPFISVATNGNLLKFVLEPNLFGALVNGNQVEMRDTDGVTVSGTVTNQNAPNLAVVAIDPGQSYLPAVFQPMELRERVLTNRSQSVVYREFSLPRGKSYSQVWLSLDLDGALGAKVYLDGQPVVAAQTGVEDTAAISAPPDLGVLSHAYRLDPGVLAGGVNQSGGTVLHRVAVEFISQAIPGTRQDFNLRLDAYESQDLTGQNWLALDTARYPDGVRAILGGNADVRSLADNYLIMRYQAKSSGNASWRDDGSGNNLGWSQWTEPQLAEGWIKRVLAGINPFNQRVTDLFNNAVNTDVSVLTQAGRRWEGDVALNLDSINHTGLIEIYETVLRRGRMLSIDAGINYGPANDALLLAAGYLNDLYLMLGNEAWADAANPTIGIGTKDQTYGDIATALFAFKGQVDSLLAEELALLRGRDDFLQPGVETAPAYNRLYWNYTRGIDAGEAIYAVNYNILDRQNDGKVNAADAAVMFPQGHGDAYGHYLTALCGYYSLFVDADFDWVPKTEAVTVLGKPVQVGYQNERKFAAAAADLARAGRQVFDLTWRQDYRSGQTNGWEHFSATRSNNRRNLPSTRYWGLDSWASRTGQGAYLNWVVGNAILPDVDADPNHEGVQVIDRTTVPELKELPTVAEGLQTAMDNAEAGLTPLGLPENAIPFDLNPNEIVGGNNNTHFEQVYQKAKTALNNAIAAFDDAKDVTRLMRSEEDSLADYIASIEHQELAYTNALIELFGTPYPDDIGPGKTYPSSFAGPDLLHYMYIDLAELNFPGMLNPQEEVAFKIDIQSFKSDWLSSVGYSYFDFIVKARKDGNNALDLDPAYANNTNLFVEYNLSSHGFFGKPSAWQGRRASPGRIQQAISEIVKARNSAQVELSSAEGAKADLDWTIRRTEWKRIHHGVIFALQEGERILDNVVGKAKLVYDVFEKANELTTETIEGTVKSGKDALPSSVIVGLANGGDLSSPAKAALEAAGLTVKSGLKVAEFSAFLAMRLLEYGVGEAKWLIENVGIETENWLQEEREITNELRDKLNAAQGFYNTINRKLQELDDTQRNYRSLVAQGDRIQQEREVFRQRAAAVIQGYRTRDAAFRVFRNEKLERYKSLFDLAARYAFMAAKAYDYETGLLYTDQGREFVSRIVSARALGVVKNGEPQFAGSDTGDPGLSSALAEMQADWLVLKGRLGFNNPDAYGTTMSIRTENLRILPGADGDTNWKDALNRGKKANLLEDSDVRQYCMQIDPGNGLPVPGIVLEFSTTVADGLNLFGKSLAGGDHAFSPSLFATKIFSVGVALEGYQGMDDPIVGGSVQSTTGTDPTAPMLNPLALAATPYVYLIPVGVDSMRSPPLGDASVIRTWSVADVSVPLPFNLGGSDFSTKKLWQSSDSLTEPLYALRKHQAFRPVAGADAFSSNIYGLDGRLAPSQYTNKRLVGRSVWNSRWKLVIPGHTLLNDPNEGLDRFIQTVHDIKLHWVTYSYAGN